MPLLRNKQELRLRRYFVTTARRFRFTAPFLRYSEHIDAQGRYT